MRARQPPVSGNHLPGARLGARVRSDHQRNENAVVANALEKVVDFGGGITVKREAKIVWLESLEPLEHGFAVGARRSWLRS